ncbi:MAG: helix-turn-helix domain-containing protein [Defluviitaleaceae bacterium]|nr:helix-turn-helix domain-containing protein [Defluviitaleaceae bacterium]
MSKNNIKHYRILAGLSQKELAKRLGLTQGAISLFESESRSPSLTLIRNMLEHLNATAGQLIGTEPITGGEVKCSN